MHTAEAGRTMAKAIRDATVREKEACPNEVQVLLPDGDEFVIIFHCSRKSVPDKIQVIPSGGGNGGTTNGKREAALKKTVIEQADVDWAALFARCSVDSINVRSNNEHCCVYINCTAGVTSDVGFNHWRGPYEDFVRKALNRTWAMAVKQPEGKMTLQMKKLKGPVSNTRKKVRFVIER